MRVAMKSAGALLLCVGFSLTAFGADLNDESSSPKDSGLQLGIGAARAKYELTVPGVGSESVNNFGYKALAGYRFNRYISVEAAYEDGGSVDVDAGSGTGITAHPHLATGTAVGTLPFDNFALFARAGEAHWWYSATFAAPNGVAKIKENTDNFIWGAGASLYVEHAEVRVEYEESKTSANFAGILPVDAKLQLISLSVVWTL